MKYPNSIKAIRYKRHKNKNDRLVFILKIDIPACGYTNSEIIEMLESRDKKTK